MEPNSQNLFRLCHLFMFDKDLNRSNARLKGLMKDVKAKKINLPTSVTYRGNFRILRRMVMPNFDFQMSTIVEIKKRFNWMMSTFYDLAFPHQWRDISVKLFVQIAIVTLFIQADEFQNLKASDLIDIKPTTRESFSISNYRNSVDAIQNDLFINNDLLLEELIVSNDFNAAKSNVTDGLFATCGKGDGMKLSQSKVKRFVNDPTYSLNSFKGTMSHFVNDIEAKALPPVQNMEVEFSQLLKGKRQAAEITIEIDSTELELPEYSVWMSQNLFSRGVRLT